MGIQGIFWPGKISGPSMAPDGAASGADAFKQYSGMRVKVSDELYNLLFAAIFEVAPDGAATLRQLPELDFMPQIPDSGNPDSAQKLQKVNLRGYSERDKKAVYMEGNITPDGEKLWKLSDLTLLKVLNDRAFYRVDSNIDAIAASVELGQSAEKPCRLTNMSKGGANILSDEVYSIGDKLELRVKLRPEAAESSIGCEVVRITENHGEQGLKYEYGCRFDSLSNIDQNHLAKNILQATAEKRK